MNIQDLNPEEFFQIYTDTVQALVELNQDAMLELMKKSDPAFSMFCMEEMLSRVIAAIISQKKDPGLQAIKFGEELQIKVQMLMKPSGVMQ